MVARVALVTLLAAACGRIDFDPIGAASLSWAGNVIAGQGGAGKTDAFSLQAVAAGDLVLLHTACDFSGTATTANATAPGWTFLQLGTVFGQTTKWGALFAATAPDTAATTVSITWNVSCSGIDVVADDFANASVDAFDLAMDTTQCSGSVTTATAHDLVWAACSSAGTIKGIGAGYTKAGDDGQDDWSEYALTTDPAGTVEATQFTTSGGKFVMTTVALAPR